MSKTTKYNDKYSKRSGRRVRDRTVQARGVPRPDPDLRRMGKALIAFAIAEAEAKAAAENQGADPTTTQETPNGR